MWLFPYIMESNWLPAGTRSLSKKGNLCTLPRLQPPKFTHRYTEIPTQTWLANKKPKLWIKHIAAWVCTERVCYGSTRLVLVHINTKVLLPLMTFLEEVPPFIGMWEPAGHWLDLGWGRREGIHSIGERPPAPSYRYKHLGYPPKSGQLTYSAR